MPAQVGEEAGRRSGAAKGQTMGGVTLFSSHFPPHLGGVERYTENLARALAARGRRVTVVTTDISGGAPEEERDGYRILRLRCGSLMGGRYPIPLPCARNRRVWETLERGGADGVLICCRFYPLSLLAARWARRRGLTPVVVEHGSDYLRVGNPPVDAAFHVYEHVFTALMKRTRPAFYGVSGASCRWLETFGIRAAGTLYNAVDTVQIAAFLASPEKDYRASYAVPAGDMVVTFTGRLLLHKGPMELIAAVESLPANCPVTLFLAGDGDLAQEVERHSSRRIIYLGRIDFAQVMALLAQTDVFCFPSVYPEGFPTSVLEAAAAGCYLAATAAGGTPELLQDERFGTLLPDNRPETIARVLLWACGHPEERKAAAARTRERVKERFTWEATARAAERAVGLTAKEEDGWDACAADRAGV